MISRHLPPKITSKPPNRRIKTGDMEQQRPGTQTGVKLPPQLDDPSAELTPQLIVEVIRDVAFHYFPQLAPGGAGDSH